jgi:hypothetical protein
MNMVVFYSTIIHRAPDFSLDPLTSPVHNAANDDLLSHLPVYAYGMDSQYANAVSFRNDVLSAGGPTLDLFPYHFEQRISQDQFFLALQSANGHRHLLIRAVIQPSKYRSHYLIVDEAVANEIQGRTDIGLIIRALSPSPDALHTSPQTTPTSISSSLPAVAPAQKRKAPSEGSSGKFHVPAIHTCPCNH